MVWTVSRACATSGFLSMPSVAHAGSIWLICHVCQLAAALLIGARQWLCNQVDVGYVGGVRTLLSCDLRPPRGQAEEPSPEVIYITGRVAACVTADMTSEAVHWKSLRSGWLTTDKLVWPSLTGDTDHDYWAAAAACPRHVINHVMNSARCQDTRSETFQIYKFEKYTFKHTLKTCIFKLAFVAWSSHSCAYE